MSETIEVKEGQIWRERDARFTRYVKILESPRDWIRVRTCDEYGTIARGSRASLVAADRFPKAFVQTGVLS